ncbi:MAG: hypothetical protein LQ352_000900 [Teloschistes flavicans]|nr:MAG: hypothetical protein LQ352_000900 [Teloschistes flavicans]
MAAARPTSILVLGAGELGLPILHSLRALGVRFLAADIASSTVSELASSFGDYDTVIGCTGFSGSSGTQLKLARAVLQAGVVHYYPWQFGVDYDVIGPEAAGGLFREQCEVRRLLRAQTEVKWTIVSTGMFATFLFEPGFGVVEGGDAGKEDGGGGVVVVRALGGWENRVTVMTPEDIGRVVAELVLLDGRTGVVFTAGDTLTYGQLADAVEEKVGREKVRREVWTLDYLRTELERDPENGIKRYRLVFAEGKGVSWDKSSTANEERGLATTDLRRFLASNDDVVNEH